MIGAATVAVLGMGAMGRGIARRLVEAGHRVRVWNRTPGRAGLGGVDVTECATPREAAKDADHVLTVLADDNALTAVLVDGPDALVAGLAADQIVVNLGTVAAATIRSLAQRLAPTGAHLVDAGMLGNATHAQNGELRLYLGGDAEVVERATRILSDLAKEVVQVGPLGAGMNLKLVLNQVMGLEMQALAEAVALGERLGLSRAQVLDTVGGSGFASPVMRFKAQRMAAQRYGHPDFRLALMAKDLGLADEAAAAAGEPLPMTGAAYAAHRRACEAGRGDDDCAAIVETVAGSAT